MAEQHQGSHGEKHHRGKGLPKKFPAQKSGEKKKTGIRGDA